MEEVGAQVAHPIFIHRQTLAARFSESHHPMAKKRGLSFRPTEPHHQQGLQNPMNNWNPKLWDWDSARFVAKPLVPDVLRLDTATATAVQSESQRRRREEENNAANSANLKKNPNAVSVDEDDERLIHLKLGGLDSATEAGSRPNKRVRCGSPGGSNYPMCQVDNCKEDLSNAKDYHRRHKVCEVHSKASKALVGKQVQRFCQQCSRFHPLSEFDEGKRSCRRRLAGHNRRRRKTQPEVATSRLLLPGNRENTVNGDLDIVNLLTVLARAQGNTGGTSINCPSMPNKDRVIQILSKINSLPLPADFAAKLPISECSNKGVPHQVSSENQDSFNASASSPSTMDLLAVLSATPAAPASDTLELSSQRSSQGSDSEKTSSACMDQATCLNLQQGPSSEFPRVGGEIRSSSYQSPTEDLDCQIQETRANLPLQLFSSSPEYDSPPKLASGGKYFSSDSSNPMEERSRSSSPPVVHKLFPMQTSRETMKPESMSMSGEVNTNVGGSQTRGCLTSLDLFGGSSGGAGNCSVQNLSYHAEYTSSSGSDLSPSSFHSDAQDRTGRIIFKLFDKDPSHLPGTLRTQIHNWLSRSPSEMEGYIRPGCVVLSIYLSMPSSAWDQLEENLFQWVSSLVQDYDTDFWGSERFLVHTDRQLASHKCGKIHLRKSRRGWNSPEIMSVSPLAVVGGQETSLLLKGRNMSTPGTRIHCTHMGGYISKEVPRSACNENASDEIRWGCFTISGATSPGLGRCFIEVENGLRGTSFPVIIADAPICQELRLLESEIEGGKIRQAISEDYAHDFGMPRSREEVLHFLNELGWLFQRKGIPSVPEDPDYKLSRFKFLLVFSVERDFCALVKTLVDILIKRNFGRHGLSKESLEMLSEIHLLNRAVKRRCRNMVDLLVQYSVLGTNDTSKNYIFQPNLVGPGGVTPLHLAACTSNSDDMVDALTSDPQEIGLRCWDSLVDVNGLSPYAYALMRSNHSYNRLVARKLADKKSCQVSISIENEIEQKMFTGVQDHRPTFPLKQVQKSCSKCAIVAARYNRRIPSSEGLLHRRYIHSMLAVAAVCVCVCLFLRGSPNIGLVAPFMWENLDYGPV
ncbi:unnamed protein product [Ilex paraguariensis]|uniref:SBP-type domain-containing protein n=1 Tax=Ilex paraguariensis TaxID=185542 RepID=A0ABC8UQU2_9AQUA